MTDLPRALFLSHGGGPLPLLGDPAHQEMVVCLENIAATIPGPDALLVVSAHWEEPLPAITAASKPSLIYDYYGFPEESYDIRYPCAGEPSLAREVHGLLDNAGIESRLDESRGLDHGVFVPLKIMYPESDIPCVQLSLVNSLDPATHMDIGRALGALGKQNVLVIGSGFSFHNMKAFFSTDTAESRELNTSFEQWLAETCSNREIQEAERTKRLARWADAPGARYCHPREEHLLPLHVCYGVARAPCTDHFHITIMNKQSSLYLW